MNRRRLLIVVVLAVLFGAALPYIEMLFAHMLPERTLPEDPSFERAYFATHTHTVVSHFTIILKYGDSQIDRSAEIEEQYNVSLPMDGWGHLLAGDGLFFHKFGWPFRAVWYRGRAGSNVPGFFECDETAIQLASPPKWIHHEIPARVIWAGMFGNVVLSMALFAGTYCALATARARHRFKQGKCWKCGYLSNGAAVCPECGAGVKA